MSEMYGFWFDLAGKKLKKLERWELREAKRLWARHADIRLGHPSIATHSSFAHNFGDHERNVTHDSLAYQSDSGHAASVTHLTIAHQKEEE